MRQAKKFKYRGEKSEILDSIIHEGYEIKSLKHGNTGHILYKFPSKIHAWEMCWTMDLQTAKSGVTKYLAKHKNANSEESNSPVESNLDKIRQ